jgi:hypothetical protein
VLAEVDERLVEMLRLEAIEMGVALKRLDLARG